jgi:hypothetical protein
MRGELTKVAIYPDETFPTPSETAWLKPDELATDGQPRTVAL